MHTGNKNPGYKNRPNKSKELYSLSRLNNSDITVKKDQNLRPLFIKDCLLFTLAMSCPLIIFNTGIEAQQNNIKSPSSQNSGLPEIVVPTGSSEISAKDREKDETENKGSGSYDKKGSAKEPSSKRHLSDQTIVVLVNDEPITGYEISQRQRLMVMGNPNVNQKAQASFKAIIQSPSTNETLKSILNQTVKENQGKSKEEILPIFEQRKKDFARRIQEQAMESARKSVFPNLRKEAINELIDERLKLQEAKKLNALASDEEINKFIQTLAEKNKLSEKEFLENLKKSGTDINALKARFKATMSWQEVIRRRYGSLVSITERDVDRFVQKASITDDINNNAELLLQRITLSIPPKIDQKQLTARMSKADVLVQMGGGCALMSTNAASVPEAKFENLGSRQSQTIPEPTRTLLINSKDGDLLPPILTKDGIEIWAVCSRKNSSNTDEKRQSAQAELRQKEFEVLAKKHLNNLRQDAAIEYR